MSVHINNYKKKKAKKRKTIEQSIIADTVHMHLFICFPCMRGSSTDLVYERETETEY